MVLLLFPSVTVDARGLEDAAFFIVADEGLSLPVLARRESIVFEYLRLSPEVLPVVGIVALSLIVLLVEGTPLSFEVEHVEVEVLVHEVNDPRLDVSLGVSKGAVLSIVALRDEVGELGAVLCLVLFYVVQPFNPVVRELARILKLTSVSFSIVAHIRRVLTTVIGTSLVLVGVPTGTVLVVMLMVD
jgi:hypothetical protein